MEFGTTKVTDSGTILGLGKQTLRREYLNNHAINPVIKYKLGFTAHRCIVYNKTQHCTDTRLEFLALVKTGKQSKPGKNWISYFTSRECLKSVVTLQLASERKVSSKHF